MEFKIRLLAKFLAIFAGLFCLALSIDELMPTTEVDEIVVQRIEERTEEGKSLYIEYFIVTDTRRRMEVPIENYTAIDSGDALRLFITPYFHQIKSFESTSRVDGEVLSAGDPGVPRQVPFIAGIAAILFAVFSAFIVKGFELKIALAFFALVITAVRWWFIGI